MLFISRLRAASIIAICLCSMYLAIPSVGEYIPNSLVRFFPTNKVNLGLDLKGGASLLLEVDTKSYLNDQLQGYVDQIKNKLKVKKIAFQSIKKINSSIEIDLLDASNIKDLKEIIAENLPKNEIAITDNIVQVSLATTPNIKKDLINQTLEIVRRRVDETGTKEIDLQIQGDDQILLQVPGLNNPSEIKNILGKTAKLSFYLVDESVSNEDIRNNRIPFGSKVLQIEERTSQGEVRTGLMAVKSRPLMSGDMLSNAKVSLHENNVLVAFTLNRVGGKIFGEVTTNNVNKLLAIALDDKIISAPAIREPILGGTGTISGNFNIQSANELALLLRAGALPATIHIVEERTVGPSLGADSIAAGKKAMFVGVSLVMLFMFIFYSLFGIVANFALLINLIMIIAALSLFNATLTMPGIAGMVLTLGMAVDANVLIFERIKEERNKGMPPLVSLTSGYNLAFATILDSNITTVIVGVILYACGTGAIRGFAVTLVIGILCSMFTSISLTKLIIFKWYKIRLPKYLPL